MYSVSIHLDEIKKYSTFPLKKQIKILRRLNFVLTATEMSQQECSVCEEALVGENELTASN